MITMIIMACEIEENRTDWRTKYVLEEYKGKSLFLHGHLFGVWRVIPLPFLSPSPSCSSLSLSHEIFFEPVSPHNWIWLSFVVLIVGMGCTLVHLVSHLTSTGKRRGMILCYHAIMKREVSEVLCQINSAHIRFSLCCIAFRLVTDCVLCGMGLRRMKMESLEERLQSLCRV